MRSCSQARAWRSRRRSIARKRRRSAAQVAAASATRRTRAGSIALVASTRGRCPLAPFARRGELHRRFELADGARRGGRVEIGLVHHHQVGHLEHALLDRLQVVAGVGQLHQQEQVGHAGDGRLALADADRLDDDHVEASRLDDADRLAGGRGDAAEGAAARLGRTNAPSSTESRSMRVLSPRIEPPERRELGSTASTATRLPPGNELEPEALDEGRLADAGHTGDADAQRRLGRHRQGGEQRVGAPAMLGSLRFEQRDRLGHRPAPDLGRTGRDRVDESLIGGRQGRRRGHRLAAAAQCAATAWRICSSTSLALAGIGVPGP
jgi:hypothetical protein